MITQRALKKVSFNANFRKSKFANIRELISENSRFSKVFQKHRTDG